MRIAVDGLHLFGAEYAGIQGTTARLTAAYRRLFPEDEIFLYVPRDFQRPRELFFPAAGDETVEGQDAEPRQGPHPCALPEDDAGLRLRRTWFAGRRRIPRTLWRAFRLQARAYHDGCELLHGPTYHLPAALSMRAVLTVHDVFALTHPEFCTPGSRRAQALALRRGVAAARRVIVPSETVKREVVRVLNAPEDKIAVIPWAAGAEFRPIKDRALLEAARRRWKLPQRFILYVGNLEPKKNVEALIHAFFAAKVHKKLPHALVLCGRLGWKMKHLGGLIASLNISNSVFFTGYTPPHALPLLYNLAELFVLPSHEEGFGVPLLEAFACGCPAVIGCAPALRETALADTSEPAARPAAAQADKMPAGLREALEELSADTPAAEKERRILGKRGAARAAEFSWEKTARLTREVYKQAAAE